MANAEWEAIDKQHHEFEEHYCAFIDILGYKEHSKKFLANEFNLYGRFKRALESTHALNKTIDTIVSSSLLKIRFFSDSVILSHPVRQQIEDAAFNILRTCAVLSTFLSYEGLFLRGGISKGKHFERQDHGLNASFLCSEALKEAYELESKHAVHPRILIHEKIINDLSGISRKFVVKDIDHYFLHYSPQVINRNGDNISIVKKEMEDIYKIYKSCTCIHVQEKYMWLLSYYYWTVSLIHGVDMKPFEKYNVGDAKRFQALDT